MRGTQHPHRAGYRKGYMAASGDLYDGVPADPEAASRYADRVAPAHRAEALQGFADGYADRLAAR